MDSLIVTDMITLARNRAMASCVLLSGDEDIRVGVQQAQEYGVRVHILGIKPARGSQSLSLLREADTSHEWAADDLKSFLKCEPPTPAPFPAASRPDANTSTIQQTGQRNVDDRLLPIAPAKWQVTCRLRRRARRLMKSSQPINDHAT